MVKAKLCYLRMSARKVRLVTELIKGKQAYNAVALLQHIKKRSASVLNKLVRSAIANAKNKGEETESLYVFRIFVNEAATWKRSRANAFGRSSRIRKRSCHITVELAAIH
ncbi:MAG: 50S ribosomal protein L22 [Candidatus Omnitrophota bacterium]|nr:MAG: 50S ribosomal protein L22 [Candidatus Omnitrophota bacterium]